MTKNGFERNYCIMVTYDCNWDCSFCITDTHSKPKVKREDLKKKINDVVPNSEVSLSGGEPGLLPKKDMEWCIEILKEKNVKLLLILMVYSLLSILSFVIALIISIIIAQRI